MARVTAIPFTAAEIGALLDSIPGSAFLVGPDLRIVAESRAFRERFGRGLPATGRTCFEMSHGVAEPCERLGVACPVSRCLASGVPQRAFHVHREGRGKAAQDVRVYPIAQGSRDVRWVLGVIRPSAARFDDDVGPSVAMPFEEPATVRAVRAVASSDAPVLLLGEDGTGRRTVARTIHAWSPRRDEPFVRLDGRTVCGLLAEASDRGFSALEGTLARPSAMELAEAVHGGTLYLTEVDRVADGGQATLLRLIGRWAASGDRPPSTSTPRFRLVTASPADLGKLVRKRRFRSDLYYRISGFPIRLAPLRRRRDDLPAIVEATLARLFPTTPPRITRDALAVLQGHDYPGNLDELAGILDSAGRRGGGIIRREHLPERIVSPAGSGRRVR